MPSLLVDEVTVRFGGIVALDNVTLDAQSGKITGLIGPNGAGKTTLFNVITGLQEPAAGRVVLGGDDITRTKGHERARRGLARTFQRLEVFGSMTVRDNVRVAAEAKDRSTAERTVDELLERVGIEQHANRRADTLPTGTARTLELARALATQPSVLLLDEPGSGLNDDETEQFGTLLLELASEGLAILLVEHDVDLVMRVCAWIHVLDFGRIIAAGSPEDIREDHVVQAAYLGTEPVA